MEEFYLESNGRGKLYCRSYVPEGAVRGVVQIVHGIAEHIGRYDEFAQMLCRHGFVVVAEDHMGHGRSAVGADDIKCFFPGGWQAAVDDIWKLHGQTVACYPHLPYFLFGHSMGSFLTRTLLYRHAPTGLRGVILSGTGYLKAATLAAGIALCKAEEKHYGETGYSPLLQDMMFGAYNRMVKPTRTENDWICTDPAVVDAYTKDPLCGAPCTIGLAHQMLLGIQENQKPKNLEKMEKALPLLFLSVEQDPVGNRGKGVLRAAESFRDAGMRHIQVKLYRGCRHEMLNEPCKAQVYQDIEDWLNTKI